MRRRGFGVCWGSFVAGALCSGCGQPEPAAPVEVGVAVPFSSVAMMGDARHAWELVVDQINAGGGINDKRLAVIERDTPLRDASDLGPVADGFVNLTNEGYKYIISLVSGEAVQPMMDAAMPQGVLAMSITSEDSAVDLPEYDGMLLRGILATDRLIQTQARAMQADGFASVAIVGETRAGIADSRERLMREAYAACSTCAAASITYPAEADLYRYDWESVGADVMSHSPDVIYLVSADPSALLDTIFWTERAGYTGLYYFAHGGLMATLVPALPGSRVPERFRSYDLALPPSERLDRFFAAYEARFGDSFIPEPRLVASADYLALLALAMTQVGDDDPRAVAAAMKELAAPPGEEYGTLDYAEAARAVRDGRDIDFVGLSGALDFDARGEVPDGFVQEYRVTPSGDVEPLP